MIPFNVKDSLKWVVIFIAACFFAFAGWKAYDAIKKNGAYEIKIEQLEQNIKVKELSIELYKDKVKNFEEVLDERDTTIRDMADQIADILLDLPEDQNDKVPHSTQIFIDRLRESTYQ